MSNVTRASIWSNVCRRLTDEYGAAAVKSWIDPLEFKEDGDGACVSAPSKFLLDWVNNNYSNRIEELIKEEAGEPINVRFVCDLSQTKDQAAIPHEPSTVCEPQTESVHAHSASSASDIELNKNYTFENFVVGRTNEFAFAAAKRVAESEVVTFNPLFIHGGVGLGKTHLLHAIAWQIKKDFPERKVLYVSAEKFMYEFIKSVRYKTTVDFKEQFRSVDVLMIDDIQFICGKESTQEEFFHTFNAIVDKKRQVIISADSSPNDLDGMEERMRSRLGWGLVADIHPTNYELRLSILQEKVKMAKVAVPTKVLEFIAHKITSNVRELEGALNIVLANSMLMKKEITLETTQEFLGDIVRASNKRVTVDEIQRKVAEHFSIKLADMFSSKRAKQISHPRQIAMYLSKHLTTSSLPDIGRKFGGRDHSTVIHAINKITKEMETDYELSEDVKLLTRMLS